MTNGNSRPAERWGRGWARMCVAASHPRWRWKTLWGVIGRLAQSATGGWFVRSCSAAHWTVMVLGARAKRVERVLLSGS